jgi:hypothetical protein
MGRVDMTEAGPKTARARLLEQHERLRDLLGAALALAGRHLSGDAVAVELSATLAELRAAFVAHNELETSLLEPMLLATGTWGPARLERMLEEHAGEHVAFTSFLTRPLDEVAPGMVDFVEEIEAHMAAEERTFLSAAVAREIEKIDGVPARS